MAGIFLYVKQHTVTGKFYFGKTVRDPLKYRGSGTVWNRHIKVHGKDQIAPLWSERYDIQEECSMHQWHFKYCKHISIGVSK